MRQELTNLLNQATRNPELRSTNIIPEISDILNGTTQFNSDRYVQIRNTIQNSNINELIQLRRELQSYRYQFRFLTNLINNHIRTPVEQRSRIEYNRIITLIQSYIRYVRDYNEIRNILDNNSTINIPDHLRREFYELPEQDQIFNINEVYNIILNTSRAIANSERGISNDYMQQRSNRRINPEESIRSLIDVSSTFLFTPIHQFAIRQWERDPSLFDENIYNDIRNYIGNIQLPPSRRSREYDTYMRNLDSQRQQQKIEVNRLENEYINTNRQLLSDIKEYIKKRLMNSKKQSTI